MYIYINNSSKNKGKISQQQCLKNEANTINQLCQRIRVLERIIAKGITVVLGDTRLNLPLGGELIFKSDGSINTNLNSGSVEVEQRVDGLFTDFGLKGPPDRYLEPPLPRSFTDEHPHPFFIFKKDPTQPLLGKLYFFDNSINEANVDGQRVDPLNIGAYWRVMLAPADNFLGATGPDPNSPNLGAGGFSFVQN